MTDNYTISELITLGNSGEAYFEGKLGYTEANFIDVTLWRASNHVIYFSLQDDFQKELHYNNRFKCDSMMSIHLEDFWNTLEQWPNREQRELEIMARKLASLDANLDQIQSQQVLAFVRRLQREIDEIRRLLTHQPEEIFTENNPDVIRADDSADDDTIPF